MSIPRLNLPLSSRAPDEEDFADHAVDLYEWLSLITLESPRVSVYDKIDPYLSRYAPPDAAPEAKTVALVKVTWEGFLCQQWAHGVFVQTLTAATSQMWFAFAVSGFDSGPLSGFKDSMVLKLPGADNGYVSWDVD